LDRVLGDVNEVSWFWLGGDTLHCTVGNSLFVLGCGLLEKIVCGCTLEEIVSGCRLVDVFNSDVNSLCQDSVLDTLVDNDADSPSGHVKDSASLTVVNLVRHTLLDVTGTLLT
jgi:hypothetical protein